MRSQHEIDAILRDVQARLDAKRGPTGIALRVPRDGYVEDDSWLNVVVTPLDRGVRASQYVEALGEVERELRAAGVGDVLLVPALAE